MLLNKTHCFVQLFDFFRPLMGCMVFCACNVHHSSLVIQSSSVIHLYLIKYIVKYIFIVDVNGFRLGEMRPGCPERKQSLPVSSRR